MAIYSDSEKINSSWGGRKDRWSKRSKRHTAPASIYYKLNISFMLKSLLFSEVIKEKHLLHYASLSLDFLLQFERIENNNVNNGAKTTFSWSFDIQHLRSTKNLLQLDKNKNRTNEYWIRIYPIKSYFCYLQSTEWKKKLRRFIPLPTYVLRCYPFVLLWVTLDFPTCQRVQSQFCTHTSNAHPSPPRLFSLFHCWDRIRQSNCIEGTANLLQARLNEIGNTFALSIKLQIQCCWEDKAFSLDKLLNTHHRAAASTIFFHCS